MHVTCRVGAGSGPEGLYAYDGATSAGPHFVQTLVSAWDYWFIDSVSSSGPGLSAKVVGYSSPDVCRACQDVPATLQWSWRDGAYWSEGSPPKHWVHPPPSSDDAEAAPLKQLNDLVAQHPDVFVGLYGVGDHRERFIVAVVEKGKDPHDWEELVRGAGSPMRTKVEESWTTIAELKRAESELGAWMQSTWSANPGRSGMAVGIDYATSTVTVTGLLTDQEKADLRSRYGDLVSFDDRDSGDVGGIRDSST